MITEWNLSLTVRDGGFRREAGLISRSSTATNIDRIQRVQVHQNPIERMVGIQRVNLPTIGEGDLHLPGTDDTELAELRDLVLDPDARIDTLDRTVSPLQVFLDTRNTSIIAVLLAVGLWFAIGSWLFFFSSSSPGSTWKPADPTGSIAGASAPRASPNTRSSSSPTTKNSCSAKSTAPPSDKASSNVPAT